MLRATEVRRLLDTHGLSARRALGQHFVVDPGIVRRIAALAGVGANRPAVEVGPGLGSLTLALAATGAEVVAVEKDPTIVPVLEEVLTQRLGPGHPAVRVVTADALEMDWTCLLGTSMPPTWTLVANLPYNVAVPVVLDVLARALTVGRLVVMVQREVADRLVAEPGGRDIGLPTLKVAWYGRARMLMTVPPEVFLPRPRVESAVVSIDRREPPSDRVEPGAVFELAERAYRHRRKMLRTTLGPHLPAGVFARSGVEPTARPEELDIGDWARLAEAAVGGA